MCKRIVKKKKQMQMNHGYKANGYLKCAKMKTFANKTPKKRRKEEEEE
jgi:hypothetical protein